MIPRSAPISPLHADLLALLASCRSAPADDTPRLVLADWLEENADVAGLQSPEDAINRAALIRVQVELARPTNDSARVMQLRSAEQKLLKANAARWLGKLPRRLHLLRQRVYGYPVQAGHRAFKFNPLATGSGWRFTRGLLWLELDQEELTDLELGSWFGSPLAVWLEEASVMIGGLTALESLPVSAELRPYLGVRYAIGTAAHPTMQIVQPRPEPLTRKRCQELLKCANFALVRGLSLFAPAVNAGFLRLMADADVSGLRWLSVKGSVGDYRAKWLAAAPLVNLSALDVSGAGLGPAGMRLIVNSPHLRRLVSLSAFRNHFGCAGLSAIATSPLAETLNVLELQNTGIGDRGVAALAESPLMDRLVGPGLNLSMNPVGDGAAKALAASPNLAHYTELILRDCRVADTGAKALAESPHTANLAYLDLWNNRIGDAGAKALAASPRLKHLRDLSLRDNQITARGESQLRKRFRARVKV